MFKSKEEKRKYEREWYKTTGKEKRKAANKRWREKQREEFKEFKSFLKCSRCPEDHISCLEFHHLNPNIKEIEIGKAVSIWSISRLKKEIEKCEVLCSNCHKKEHYNKRQAGVDGDTLVL